MSQEVSAGLAVIQRQLKELDALAKQTLEDLNTVAGTERIAKWKARTVTLITDTIGRQEGLRFANIHPGPSFTNDMVEEFTDLIDCYRTPLAALVKQLTQAPPPTARS
jgi:hypothetical protein